MLQTNLPFDRDDTLRKAEKALRQGRLDAAIAAYARVVEEQPHDLATANALGDLYVRAAQSDLALPLFMRVADAHLREGFFSKAAGFYKKILRFAPNDETALLKLAEASIQQGLRVDARTALSTVLARRRARGDVVGADQVAIQLAELDPQDLDARFAAVRALARLKGTEALAGLRAAAEALQDAGREADAMELHREIVALDPRQVDSRARIVRHALAGNDATTARAYLTRQAVSEHASLVPLVAELELRDGRREQAAEALRLWMRRGPDAVTAIAALARCLAADAAPLAFLCLESAVDAATAAGRFQDAATWLEEHLRREHNDVSAWMRLVELAVDGGLPDVLSRGQAGLADAYLEQGLAREARFVSEDLLSRDPSNEAHRFRLRRALEQLGEPDAEGLSSGDIEALPIISVPPAPRPALSVETEDDGDAVDRVPIPELTPSVSPARNVVETSVPEAAVMAASRPDGPASTSDAPAALSEEAVPAPDTLASVPPADDFTADLAQLADADSADAALPEVDLTSALDELSLDEVGESADVESEGAEVHEQAEDSSVAGPTSPSLEDVFAKRRADADGRRESGAELVALADTYRAAGLLDQAAAALEKATRDPATRVGAAEQLGRLLVDRGDKPRAVEWLERAADASAGDEPRHVAILHGLGAVLEELGERDRALAVWLEILTLAPSDEAHAKVAALTAEHAGGGSFTA